ncbi:hypothetical protein FHX15_002743 [Rhizobium sp. BK650]|nr:hypothetical protein [Rhizobium sp. BK650]
MWYSPATLNQASLEIFATMKLLLGDLILTGEGKRFIHFPSDPHTLPRGPQRARHEIVPQKFDCAIAKIFGYAHNADKAGREGVGCATMTVRCAL